MKIINYLFFTLAFVLSINCTCQTAMVQKTFTGIPTSFRNEMACFMTLQKEMDSPEVLEFNMSGAKNVDSRKYFKGCNLREEYQGKKFTVTYVEQGNSLIAIDLKMVGEKPPMLEKDNFPTATCRAYDLEGKLIAIVENNTIYIIKDGKKSDREKDTKPIQNKDECCIKNECVKVKVEPDGKINFFKLPNTTDKTATLVIKGDKIYRTVKDKGEEIDQMKEYYIFKGNKTQIALIAFYTRMGMGH